MNVFSLVRSVKTEQVPGGADSLLRLARVNSSDAGNYTCAVRGARSHTVSVHVLNGMTTKSFLIFKKGIHLKYNVKKILRKYNKVRSTARYIIHSQFDTSVNAFEIRA
jgi:catabolite regulation protein CreA